MAYDPELWKQLLPGDRVCVTRFPTFEGCLHEETREVYQRLVDEAIVLRIEYLETIDGESYPWCDCLLLERDVVVERHYLMLNHDGLERSN